MLSRDKGTVQVWQGKIMFSAVKYSSEALQPSELLKQLRKHPMRHFTNKILLDKNVKRRIYDSELNTNK